MSSARPAPALIAFDHVAKRYSPAGPWAVRSLRLEIRARELFVLLGESGSGKTTLLKMVNRLVEPTRGTVSIEGQDVRAKDPIALRRGIGYAIQSVGLIPHLRIGENIALVPRLLRWSRDETTARVDELLTLVGLDPDTYRERLPSELSGGQLQRVGVARALAARPRILLMDEPFGALDPMTRAQLQVELRRLHDELGLTTLVVTHDLGEALTLADRIGVMRDGALLQVGTAAALMSAPATGYVAEFMGMAVRQARLVDALVQSETPGSAS